MYRAQSGGIDTAEGLKEPGRRFHRYAHVETVMTLDSVLLAPVSVVRFGTCMTRNGR